jgi:hypothetical protein
MQTTQNIKLLSIAEIYERSMNAGFVGIPAVFLEKLNFNVNQAYLLSQLVSSWIFYTDSGKSQKTTFYACSKYMKSKTGFSEKTQFNYLKAFQEKGWIIVDIIDKKRHIGFTKEFSAEFSVFFGTTSGNFTDTNREILPTVSGNFTDTNREILPTNNTKVNKIKNNKNANAQKNARAKNFSQEKNTAVTAPSELPKKFAAKKVSFALEQALPLAFDEFNQWLDSMGKQAPISNPKQTEAMLGVLEYFEKGINAKNANSGQDTTAKQLVGALLFCLNNLALAKLEGKTRKVSLGDKNNSQIDYFLELNHISGFYNQIDLFYSLCKDIYQKTQNKPKDKPTIPARPVPTVTEQKTKTVPPPARPVPTATEQVEHKAAVAEVIAQFDTDAAIERAQIAAQIRALGINYQQLDSEMQFVDTAALLASACMVGEFLDYLYINGFLDSTAQLSKYKGSKSTNRMDYYLILKNVVKYAKSR